METVVFMRILLALLCLFCGLSHAQSSLSIGHYFAQQQSELTDKQRSIHFSSVSLNHRSNQFTSKVVLPYLRIDGDDSSALGMGDIQIESRYKLDPLLSNLSIELGLGLKLGTAEPEKRLGTGAHDVKLFTALKGFCISQSRWLCSSRLDYIIRGSSDYYQMKNGFKWTLGLGYLSDKQLLGVQWKYKEKSHIQSFDQQSVMAYWNLPISTAWRLMPYINYAYQGGENLGFGITASKKF